MIVYTLTANIDEDLAEEWPKFMRNEVIHFVQKNTTHAGL